jgi:transposase InsO family protein
MPWKEHRTVDRREEFVLRAKEADSNVAELCREHGISRKTGYKWLSRFETRGIEGLRDMSRRPRRVVQTTGELVLRIQELRRAHLRWGPKKLRVLLVREFKEKDVPSVKTVGRILQRLGEPRLRRARRPPLPERRAVADVTVAKPNDLWTVDFKGWWKTRNGERCEPLTVRDAFSRFVLCMKVMASPGIAGVRTAFEQLFQQWGLPKAIRADNGSPFGCTRARAGLTQLSAWWVALGIEVIFGRPGHPEDNGAHERLHGDVPPASG